MVIFIQFRLDIASSMFRHYSIFFFIQRLPLSSLIRRQLLTFIICCCRENLDFVFFFLMFLTLCMILSGVYIVTKTRTNSFFFTLCFLYVAIQS